MNTNTVTALDANHNLSIEAIVLGNFMVEQAKRKSKAYTDKLPLMMTSSGEPILARNDRQNAITGALCEVTNVFEEYKRRGRLSNYVIERLFFPQVAKTVHVRRGQWTWGPFDSADYIEAVTVRRVNDVAFSCVIIASAERTNTMDGKFKTKFYALCPASNVDRNKLRLPKGIQQDYRELVSTATTPKALIKTAFGAPSITLPRLLDNLYRRVAPAMFRELTSFGNDTQRTAVERFATRVVEPIKKHPKTWLEWFDAIARGEAPALLPEMVELMSEYHKALRTAKESVLSVEHNKFVMFVQFVKDGDTYAVLPNNTFVKVTPDAPIPMDTMCRAQTLLMQVENAVTKAPRVYRELGGVAGQTVQLKVLPTVGAAHLHYAPYQQYAFEGVSHVHQIVVVPVSDAELSGVVA